MRNFKTILKGFIIGSSMSVPGVSGGTMAILLGIYDRLISAISNFFKDVKRNLLFLIQFCIGAFLGIGTLAFVISWLLDTFPIPVSFFFLGAVVGGIPALYKKTKTTTIKVSSVLYMFTGFIIVISIGFIPELNVNVSGGVSLSNLLLWLITGIIVAIALVLPGISTSHMLIVLGMYDVTLNAIKSFDLLFLAILAFSVLIGIIITTKPLEWTMNQYPHQTYCMIIGFVVGSTLEIVNDIIIPSISSNTNILWWIVIIIISIITFALGNYGIVYLSRYAQD